MKKVILLIIGLFMISGCTKINSLNYDQLLDNFNTSSHKQNVYRQGYKYYLPRGISINSNYLFNEVLSSDKEIYYLYVDGLSFNKKIKKDYKESSQSYYSKTINYQDKYGYVEINLQKNGKYLVEIMYNYAKIEVIVDKDNLNEALFTCISILKSITFNDKIIANLFENDILNFQEEEYNIFNTTSSDSTYLQTGDTYDVVEKEKLPDTDLIN